LTRFRDGAKAGIWMPSPTIRTLEYAMVDATIVKVHRHGQGAKEGLKTRRSAARKAA
jgi:hypothetical protein